MTEHSARRRNLGRNPVLLWSTFILVHLWLGLLNLYGPGLPLGDVTIVYKFWTDQILVAGYWVGIDSAWVYPFVAIVPMLAATVFGPALYASTWLAMVMVLDCLAFAAVVGWRREVKNFAAGWWWIAFLVLLGPIALGRIDSITVPVAIAGVMFASTRPLVATVLLTIAAWIKVWPAALVGALIVSVRGRWRVLVVALGISALLIAFALSLGSGGNVLSFITQQNDRGLQVEAPISTIWMWQAFAKVPGAFAYYDQALLTWQVTGDGVGVAGMLMTPLMGLAVLAVVLAGALALRRGATADVLLPLVSLGLVSALIAFNKVGSPQFISWLAVPVILGLVTRRPERPWWFSTPAALVAATAALTQCFYPYLYGWLLSLHPILLVILTARNLLLFAVLGWAMYSLVTVATWRDDPAEIPAL